jgi:hypothetical protein
LKIENVKLKIFIAAILWLNSIAFAIPGDFNADGVVAMGDLHLFAGSWLTDSGGDLDSDSDTDLADFAIFASHWLEGCDALPPLDASNVSVGVALAGDVTFVLPATSPEPLTWRVLSLPAYGTLYDAVDETLISSVPFALDANSVHYHASDSVALPVSFSWSASTAANDCGSSGSDMATASIAVYAQPVANNGTSNPVTHIWQAITLSGADEGNPSPPGKLKYIITALPTVGQIYDPKSGAGKISKVPYTLSSWGNTAVYWTDTLGADAMQFKVDDSGVAPMGGQSAAATVTINATANPKDCLSFDGRGYVSIPDGTYLDAGNGWAIDFWIKTRQPYSTVIKKRGSAQGYEIKLVGGMPHVEFYDASGVMAASFECEYAGRLDIDQWREVEFWCGNVTGGWQILGAIAGEEYVIAEKYSEVLSGSLPAMANTEPVILGTAYKGQFDKLRFFAAIDPQIVAGSVQDISGRTESGNETFFGIGAVSSVLFMCDNASGTIITDSKTGKVGTFSSADHVSWLPYFDPFADVAVQQNYRGTK